jgi:Mg2+ and Co2+ transporter CorA
MSIYNLAPLDIIAWAGFAVVVIGAIASGTVIVINAIFDALKRIEGKVDGAASVSTAKIASLQDKVISLHDVIAEKKETAAVLAANVSSSAQVEAAKDKQ